MDMVCASDLYPVEGPGPWTWSVKRYLPCGRGQGHGHGLCKRSLPRVGGQGHGHGLCK